MSNTERVHLIGGVGSPYTRKMLGLLRYRRIPYNLTWADPATELDRLGIEKPKPTFLPTFLFNEGSTGVKAVCDSTPIIRRLENQFPQRSVIPPDPALAFIDYLIEDFGDEWCTKYMFHYRWHFPEDADNAGTILPLQMGVNLSDELHQPFKAQFSERQVNRLYVVGSNADTAPIIDASYRRFLNAMEVHLGIQPFILGNRPGAGDFALYGQLTQLVGFDPTPRKITHDVSPRTVAWVGLMEDQCGLEPQESDWNTLENLPETLKALLTEIGRVYVPALLANAEALATGEKNWEAIIDGTPWRQQTFPYQGKCLKWINAQYQALDVADRARVDTALADTGCAALLK